MVLFKDFDIVLKWITSVIGCLVSFSIVRLLVYYRAFNIQITNYLSFSECILLFTDQLALFIWFAIIIISVYTTGYYIFSAIWKDFKYSDLLNLVYHDSKILRIILVLVFISPLIYLEIAFVSYNLEHARRIIFVSSTLFSILALFYIATMFYSVAKSKEQVKRVSTILTAYIIFTCTLCFYTSMLRRQLFVMEVNQLNQQVVCYDANNQKIVESNFSNNVQYLGSTKEYILFYNRSSGMSSIYRTAAFSRIDFGATNYRKVPGWSIFDILY